MLVSRTGKSLGALPGMATAGAAAVRDLAAFRCCGRSAGFGGAAAKSMSVSTALQASLYEGTGELMDYSGVAISFFTSIRIPAALVAGSSLANMFINDDGSSSSSSKGRHHWENRVRTLYHLFALLGFLLSLNVVLTTTSTSTVLLLGMKNPMARSAYELLRREVDFEFTSTRWSFFMALFSFLISVSGRALVEFRLLRSYRWRTASVVVSAIASLVLHLLSIANRSLHNWPHLGAMTLDVIRLMWKQARTYPMEAASVLSGSIAVMAGITVFVATRGFADFDRLDDNHRRNENRGAREILDNDDDEDSDGTNNCLSVVEQTDA